MVDTSGEAVHCRTSVVIQGSVAVADRTFARVALPEARLRRVDGRLVADGPRFEPEPSAELVVEPDGLRLVDQDGAHG